MQAALPPKMAFAIIGKFLSARGALPIRFRERNFSHERYGRKCETASEEEEKKKKKFTSETRVGATGSACDTLNSRAIDFDDYFRCV